jgi:hypothetical protein
VQRCLHPLGGSDTIHFKRAFREAELAPVTGAIRERHVLSVVGPWQSEAGKTTLLHAVRVMAQFKVLVPGERSLGSSGNLNPVRGLPHGPQRRRLHHLQHRTVARSPRPTR